MSELELAAGSVAETKKKKTKKKRVYLVYVENRTKCKIQQKDETPNSRKQNFKE
jgi:hypothetical protein